jgi:hypothetical protein
VTAETGRAADAPCMGPDDPGGDGGAVQPPAIHRVADQGGAAAGRLRRYQQHDHDCRERCRLAPGGPRSPAPTPRSRPFAARASRSPISSRPSRTPCAPASTSCSSPEALQHAPMCSRSGQRSVFFQRTRRASACSRSSTGRSFCPAQDRVSRRARLRPSCSDCCCRPCRVRRTNARTH